MVTSKKRLSDISTNLSVICISNFTVFNHYTYLGYGNIMAMSSSSVKHQLMEYCPHIGISGKHETVLQ